MLEIDCHSISVEELCERFNSNVVTGLTSDQAAEGLEKYGPNVRTPPPTMPEWVKMCKYMFTGPAMPLWFGAVPCFIASSKGFGVNNFYLGASLSSLATLAGLYSYYQNSKSENVIELGKKRMRLYTIGRRNGQRGSTFIEELTPGDIVELRQGDIVPADIRILESSWLKVDTSSLTGESEPQKRSPKYTHDNPLETENLVFSSTRIVAGSLVGMVVNVGDNTVMGSLAGLSSGVLYAQTPIDKKIENLLSMMSRVAVALGAGLAVIAHLYDINWLYPMIVIVGVIPMMIHASLNATIAKVFHYLATYNCYVKDLEALETLGTISCICSSKTGTMTQPRMTVCHFWFDNKIETYGGDGPSFKILERAAMLCNNAEFTEDPKTVSLNRISTIGNTTDEAILKHTEEVTGNVMEYRKKNKKVCEITFNSFNKFQVTIHEIEDPDESRYLVVMKGAPEKIIEKCNSIVMDGKEIPLTQELKDSYIAAIEEVAGLGERVIGFCDMMLPEDEYPTGYPFDADEENFPLQGFRLVGLMSMIDPPRAAVPDAIRKLTELNKKVIMATGDHPVTAKAIANNVGIEEAFVVHGDHLRDLSNMQICEILTNHKGIVFARISPVQKLMIVQACQEIGHVVAVTGSGLNDTPALKSADLGIALGYSGSDAAKVAAGMILLDDNFASIVKGVEQGNYILKTLDKIPFFNGAIRGGQYN